VTISCNAYIIHKINLMFGVAKKEDLKIESNIEDLVFTDYDWALIQLI
jgi:hypothetical protein